jgi:hypothetical protein
MLDPPNFNTILWTIGVVTLVGVLATIAVRWVAFGRLKAMNRPIKAVLAVAVLTVIWAYPGIVAAGVLALFAAIRRIRSIPA